MGKALMLLRRLAFLTLWLASSAASADCGGVDLSADPSIKPDWAAHAQEMVNAEGLLWRIDKPGLEPSYLYGTMHSTAAGPMKLAREAAPYAQAATAVATELGDLNPSKKVEIDSAMIKQALAPDVDTWAGLIEGQDAERVAKLMADKGIPAELAHHLHLWMLAITASLPKCEAEGHAKGLPEVDESFAEIAKARHVPVVALESMDEQLTVIGSITPALAAAELISNARGGPFADGGYATFLSLYGQKRPAAALAVLDAVPGISAAEREATGQLLRRLLADRNDTMAERAAPWLAKGGLFIAVGALHLSGERGLVELFRGRGYAVSKVW